MSGELILLVDDEPNIVDLARMYLEREGYRVEAAFDGNQALLAGVREADVQIDPFMQVLRKLPVVPTCEERRAEKETETPRRR